MKNELSFVEANGLRFAYFEEGTGPLVLMFHGFPDTAHSWDELRPLVAAKGYRVVTPFMRGYRPTAAPKADADAETLARDVLALIDALGEKEAILIGHDWGAAAVYGAAALAPEKVTKLVAVGIPHPATLRPTPGKLWGVRHFIAYKLPGAARRFARDDFAALPGICKRWSPDWAPSHAELAPVRECFADAASLEAAFGYYRALAFVPAKWLKRRLSMPTVVFAGTGDPNAGLDDYQRGGTLFDGPYVIEQVPGGHFMHREHPAVFAERLLAHL